MGKTYDPGEVSVTIGGTIIDFDTVTTSLDEDINTLTVGTQGEVTRTKNLSRLGSIVVVLPQSSTTNATLSAQSIANGILSISVIDKGGTSVAVMPEGVFTTMPESEDGKEHGQREWTFKGSLPVYVIGGN